MGVPKFYRWMSERYPCLSEVVKEYQIPEFDNFYLDMNGIIHNCSHPNDDDVHFRITEEKIFADIFHYLEVLFRLVQPRKVFFMAIDGVAPRAKMNQQRGRRFRSAKEAEQREAEARRKGETLPEEARFDSNCITPGTEFMTRLHEQLKYFVTMKISQDPIWQGVQVILSGHQVPGEGEHKIVEFIRYQRSQPDYDHTTRHCLYGLDADLVMLGLCTHEPYFSLLREEVKFGGRRKSDKKPATVEETTFHLLHLSLLRDYLDHEFSPLKSNLPFPYNLEAIIDDWVLMGFLVGNDFIPHLPNFHIAKGALPMLYNTYMEVLPTLGGYINEGGLLNLERFQKFMEKVAQIDYDHFNDIYADLKWFQGKTGRKQIGASRNGKAEDKGAARPNRSADALKFLQEKAAEIDLLLGEDGESENVVIDDQESVTEDNDSDVSEDEDEEDESSETEAEPFDEHQMMHAEFSAHKRNYYIEKLEYADVTTEVLRDQAEGYVRAIQWNLHYYYNGVCSWSWYYPHHYAPYASDIKNFAASLKMEFDLAKPFLPYQQLLGVLPAASRGLLPSAYQTLMTSPNSPIIHYYPAEFETDKNGKQQEWEAVVLIPFIDEVCLIEAMDECESKMTQAERERNSHGPMQIYVFSDKDLGTYTSPGYFPSIPHNRAVCKEVPREYFVLPSDKILKGLHPNINLDICVPGFPTLRHIQHTASLKKAGVTVFNMSSQQESMILQVVEQGTPDVQKIAEQLLSKTVLMQWPHLVEARVVSVATKDWKFTLSSGDPSKAKDKDKPTPKLSKEQMNPDMAEEWRLSIKGLTERYANRWGVEIGTTQVLLKVCPIQGRKYIFTQNGRVTLEKQWTSEAVSFPYHMTVVDVAVADAVGKQYKTLEELFPAGSVCFMLGHPGYGSQGQVLSSDASLKGKLRVSFATSPDGNYETMRKKWRSFSTQYLPAYVAARAVNISSHLLSRITGTVYINVERKEDPENGNREKGRAGRVNVGLNLKFNKRNEEVPGWSRKTGTTWMYSQKTVETLRAYLEKFPEFFDFISQNIGNDVYEEKDIFPGPQGHARMCQMIDWVQSLPCMKAQHQACGTIAIDRDLLPELVAHVNSQEKAAGKPIVMQVRPHLLYKPSLNVGSVIPDPSATYQLFDRVINVREGFSVPLGLKGTIISVKTAAKRMDEVYEVLFDSEFVGGLPVKGLDDSPRIYYVPPWSLINISHGRRVHMEREMQGRPIAVVYPTGAAEQARFGQQQQARDKQTNQTGRQDSQPKMARPRPDEARGRSATAPAPANLPKPEGAFFSPGQNSKQQPAQQQQQQFTAIWNALSQGNHAHPQPLAKQQPTPKKNAAPENAKHVEKQKKPFPSLQEAAKALPMIPKSKVEESAKKTEPMKETAAKPTPVVPPATKDSAAPVLGQSLSVQDLFKMAGQSLVPPPVPAPVVPEPITVSRCLQLLNLCQQKGLGIPLYSYLPLQGTVAAEIKLPSFGTVASAAGATREEAAERAASLALQHPMMHQAIPAAVPFPGMPMIPPQFVGPFPPHFLPAPMPPMSFPLQQPMRYPPSFNSLVPMQVTRQKVHQSRPATAAPRKSAPQPVAKEEAEVKGQSTAAGPLPTTVSEARAPSQASQVTTVPSREKDPGQAKPPGKRLAIRFGTPGS